MHQRAGHAKRFMHRFDRDKLRELVMRPFLGDHGARNHADDFASCSERRIGQNPHQTNAPSAVNDAETAPRASGSESGCGLCKLGRGTKAGACVDTNSRHHVIDGRMNIRMVAISVWAKRYPFAN